MTASTKIEWTDSTFSPWSGCTKISPACDHCYAEALSKRAPKTIGQWGAGAPRRLTSPAYWKQPLRWNAAEFRECDGCGHRGEARDWISVDPFGCPVCGVLAWTPARRRVFCASLADVFDNEVDPQWRRDLFDLIARTPNLDWLLLTKRVGNVVRMIAEIADMPRTASHAGDLMAHQWRNGNPPSNIWLGATICNQAEAHRDIPKLLGTRAAVRFLSIEPMLGPIDLTVDGLVCLPCRNAEHMMMDPTTGAYECCRACDYTGIGDEWGIDWIICGGESGPHARPMHPDWARSLRDQCAAAGVPFLFKQWGEFASVSEVEGPGIHHHFPDGATVRRIGKHAAGRLLDGVEHNGVPAQ